MHSPHALSEANRQRALKEETYQTMTPETPLAKAVCQALCGGPKFLSRPGNSSIESTHAAYRTTNKQEHNQITNTSSADKTTRKPSAQHKHTHNRQHMPTVLGKPQARKGGQQHNMTANRFGENPSTGGGHTERPTTTHSTTHHTAES